MTLRNALRVTVLPALLLGCEGTFDIAVEQMSGKVTFKIPVFRETCAHEVRVYRADARTDPIWYIDSRGEAAPPEQCVSTFTYGMPPPGFNQIVAAEQLKSGIVYVVSIDRPGAGGIEFFAVGPRDDPINRDPPNS